jgi:hypothetical protein
MNKKNLCPYSKGERQLMKLWFDFGEFCYSHFLPSTALKMKTLQFN